MTSRINKLKLLSAVATSALLFAGIASAQQTTDEGHKALHERAQSSQSGVQSETHGQANSNEMKGRNAAEKQSSGATQHKNARAEKSSTTGQASPAEKPGNKSNAENNSQNGKNEHGKNAAMEHGRKSSTTGQASSNEINGKNSTEKRSNGAAPHNAKKNENAGAQKSSTTGQAQRNESQPQVNTTQNQKSSTTGQANQNEQNARQNQPGTQPASTAHQASPNGQTNSQQTAQVQGAQLNAQQVTKVRDTVFSSGNVPRVEHVDFSINVGTHVPPHVHLVAVPSTLVDIYPQWRDDEYFVVRDDIVILDHSRRIVAVIPAHAHRASVSEEINVSELSQPEIREIQTVLIRRGFLHARADGIFGPETRDALITFQRREGLQAKGEIDTRTVSSLGLSGKINVRTQGTSATTGQGPSNNASQKQMDNSRQEQHNKASQAQQNNEGSSAQHGAQSRTQEPTAKQSTTGQGNESSETKLNANSPNKKEQ